MDKYTPTNEINPPATFHYSANILEPIHVTTLQQEHSSTGNKGSHDVSSELPAANLDRHWAHGTGSAVGAGGGRGGAASGGTSGSGRSGDTASTSAAGLLQQVRALAIALGGALGVARTIEVTGLVFVGALLVPLVHDEGELLLGRADTVRSVLALGAVLLDTIAHSILGADVVKQVLVVVFLDGVLNDARQGINHAGAQIRVRRRREFTGSFPVLANRRAGCGSSSRGSVAGAVDASGSGLLDLLREVREVIASLDAVTIDLHQSIVVGLLEVHVDDTTAPDVVHLGAVQDRGIGELARFRVVASILGEECRNREILEFLSALLVTRGLEGRIAAPFVDVVTEHVDHGIALTANEVVLQVITDASVIVGGVTDEQGFTVLLGLDILLHVTNSALDERNRVGIVLVVGDLVTGKETNNIGVVGEGIDNASVAGVQVHVPLGVVTVDRLRRGGQIGDKVDAGVVKHLHALSVVGLGVNGIGTDDVGPQFLQVRDITLALLGVGQRVGVVAVGFVTVACAGAAGAIGRIFLYRSTLVPSPITSTQDFPAWNIR